MHPTRQNRLVGIGPIESNSNNLLLKRKLNRQLTSRSCDDEPASRTISALLAACVLDHCETIGHKTWAQGRETIRFGQNTYKDCQVLEHEAFKLSILPDQRGYYRQGSRTYPSWRDRHQVVSQCPGGRRAPTKTAGRRLVEGFSSLRAERRTIDASQHRRAFAAVRRMGEISGSPMDGGKTRPADLARYCPALSPLSSWLVIETTSHPSKLCGRPYARRIRGVVPGTRLPDRPAPVRQSVPAMETTRLPRKSVSAVI